MKSGTEDDIVDLESVVEREPNVVNQIDQRDEDGDGECHLNFVVCSPRKIVHLV